MNSAGLSGGILTAVDSFRPSLVARSTEHQAMLFGVSAAIGYGFGHGVRKSLDVIGIRHRLLRNPWARTAVFGTATAVSVPIIMRRADQERAAHADWGVPAMRPGVAVAEGTAVALALISGGTLVTRGIRKTATAASASIGGPAPVWGVAASAAVAGALAAAAPAVKRALFDHLVTAGITPDPSFAQPPANPLVSGGPSSLVPYSTHAREGSRFVHLARTQHEVEELTGQLSKAPIRVFIGVSAAATPAERVELAVAELHRLGAFRRRAILAVSPAGTGYSNPVPVEAFELLSHGDCATVAVQYGVLPSMFSTSLLPDAAQTHRLLIDALTGQGPKLFSYGESLGAEAAQLALQSEPSLWREDGSFAGVDAALFVGTPAGAGIRRAAEHRAAILVADRWQDLPSPVPAQFRVFLLDHDADPVTRFETSLIWTRPDWLAAKPRGRGTPDEMAWRPLLTWMQVGFDVARATQPQLGEFQSHGHDYRADLAPLVRAAFVPDAPDDVLAAVQEELVRSELRRAQLLGQ